MIDKWENYVEGDVNILDNIEENNIEKIFYSNIKNACLTDRFTVFKGDSSSVLLDLIKNGKKFNFIYVDGCHTLLESYTDLLLSFEILEKGGILAADDIPYNNENILNSPLEGAKYFLKKYEDKIKILNVFTKIININF